MEPTININVSTAEALIRVIGTALDQAFGGGGLQLLTHLQAQVNQAQTQQQQAQAELMAQASDPEGIDHRANGQFAGPVPQPRKAGRFANKET